MIAAALDAVRRLGAVDGGLFVLSRVLEALSGRRVQLFKYYFMAQPVPRAHARAQRGGGIVVEELRRDDPRLARLDRPRAELQRRFATSARCFAAWQGEALAGFLWFTERQYDEDEVGCSFRLDPADDAVWDFDVHVMPRFRLGRTFGLLWDAAFAAMRARGARWSISRVTAFNADSLRAHQRLGAQRTGQVAFLLFGPFQITFGGLGGVKCRRLEQGPYPTIEVRAPANGTPEGLAEAAGAAPASGDPTGRLSGRVG